MPKWYRIAATCVAFLLPVALAAGWRYRSTSDEKQELIIETARQLSVIPVRKLTTAEVTLNRMGCWATSNSPDLIERAEKAGPWAVLSVLPVGKALRLAQYAIRVLAGGMAINELVAAAVVRDAILQEVTVSIQYGVDLETISPDRIDVSRRSITLRLPPPQSLGPARIDLDRSPTIGRQTSESKQDAEWARLQQLAFEDAQVHTQEWVRAAGLESTLREQSRAVIHKAMQTQFRADVPIYVIFDDEWKAGER